MKKVKFETVSMPAPEKAILREIAEQECRSMAQQISYWIQQHQFQKSKESHA